MLGTGSRAIRGARASFSPAPTARTDEESTVAYERSICPASRNLSSSSSCSRSHTPALRQSFSRRQQVAPEPKPNTVGRWFHRRPVFNTNRMPFNAARSETRGRPGCSLRRGLGGGSNGSISVHNSSSMIGASIPWVPLFRHPRLTACRESKQPPQGFLNWPLRARSGRAPRPWRCGLRRRAVFRHTPCYARAQPRLGTPRRPIRRPGPSGQ